MASGFESPSLAPNETCATLAYAPIGFPSNCRAWRSCRSCLQKIGCILTSSNRCASLSETDPNANVDADYRKAFDLNVALPNATVSNPQGLADNQSWVFPANEATYCPVDDATCAKCKSESFYRPGGFADSRFCVGAGGCVCVFNCEAIDPLATLGECSTVAAAPTSAPPMINDQAKRTNDAFPPSTQFTLIGAFVAVLAIAYFLANKHGWPRRRTANQQAPPPRARVSGAVETEAVTLGLSGWNQHRQKLITDENQRLAGDGDAEPTAFAQLRSPTNSVVLPPATSTPPPTRPSPTDQ